LLVKRPQDSQVMVVTVDAIAKPRSAAGQSGTFSSVCCRAIVVCVTVGKNETIFELVAREEKRDMATEQRFRLLVEVVVGDENVDDPEHDDTDVDLLGRELMRVLADNMRRVRTERRNGRRRRHPRPGFALRDLFRKSKTHHTPNAAHMTEDCAICLEPFALYSRVYHTRCQHVFHPECIFEVLMHDMTHCPVCRANLLRAC